MKRNRPLRILVVEDEALIALAYKLELESAGYEVIGMLRSVNDAENFLRDETPDLILLDIYLKGNRSGIDLAKQVRQTSLTPIIFLTASSHPDMLDEIELLNNCHLLTKPVNSDKLEQLVAGMKKAS